MAESTTLGEIVSVVPPLVRADGADTACPATGVQYITGGVGTRVRLRVYDPPALPDVEPLDPAG